MPSRAIKVVAFLLAVLLLTGAVLILWMVIPPPPRPTTQSQPVAAPASVPVPGPGDAQPATLPKAPPPASKPVGDTRYYAGQPVPGPGFTCKLIVLDNTGYSVGYCPEHKGPAWAAYRVFDNGIEQAPPRPAKFTADMRVLDSPQSSDYTRTGYDRGHCAPNYIISVCYGTDAQRETFLMTNILPQKPALNRQVWEGIERTEARDYRRRYGTLWVVDGPIYGEHPQHLPDGEAVPDKCYRIIVRKEAKGEPKVLAYIVPQTVTGGEVSAQFLVSVDQVEEETHLDFLHDLPDEQERKIEAVVTKEEW